MEQVKKIGDRSKKRDDDAQIGVVLEANRATDRREVEVERVDEEGGDTSEQEYMVPVSNNVAVRVEDLVTP